MFLSMGVFSKYCVYSGFYCPSLFLIFFKRFCFLLAAPQASLLLLTGAGLSFCSVWNSLASSVPGHGLFPLLGWWVWAGALTPKWICVPGSEALQTEPTEGRASGTRDAWSSVWHLPDKCVESSGFLRHSSFNVFTERKMSTISTWE